MSGGIMAGPWRDHDGTVHFDNLKSDTMASVNHNLLLKNAQGVLGEYYIMIRGGKEILVRRPNRSGHVPKPSEKQGQEQFRLAQQYAAEVNRDPARKEFYRPFKKGGQSEYNLALADY